MNKYCVHCSVSRCKVMFSQCFSPFAVVSLCRVAGLTETFPSFSVSGPFLPDVPGFQVPPDGFFPPQLRSSSRTLPLHLHFDNRSDVFCFISSIDVPEPFQPSPSHNHRYYCSVLVNVINMIYIYGHYCVDG